ncbi:MAG: UDP-N-acetylmuramoyl-tripeptide--D-alanyl-D-alanine ligase, partial [Candidatus Obscuribacterales bacterium]|nr:UDP-N-acetylmuramoyl-tripeptide--D-alanyl-D-alanine ligase [Candidatus Obscuribacterales bacterium]
NFDGHSFFADAVSKGAGAIIVTEGAVASSSFDGDLLIVEVADTLDAYHDLARFWRLKIDPYVVAVTGSSGKTTTKEMCAAVFSASRKTHKSRANENNEFGVPKTILSMPEDTEVLVVELAMRGLGQIAQLAATSLADVGIITCAGTAHIELLGSRKNIARAKCELLSFLKDDGLAVLGEANELLLKESQKVYSGELSGFEPSFLSETSVDSKGTRFSINGLEVEFFVCAHGQYQLQDAWCAITAGIRAGLSAEQVRAGLEQYSQIKGRGNTIVTNSGAMIIDESYNANPDSVKCALSGFVDRRAYPHARKVAVLGEMAELGESARELHEELGDWMKELPLSRLVTVGEMASLIADRVEGGAIEVRRCNDLGEAVSVVACELTADSCIMVKGSNSTRLYDLVEKLIQ